MNQQDINTIKRECFPDLVQLADELEEKGYLVKVGRNIRSITLNSYDSVFNENSFCFLLLGYDTIREANTAFQKQLKQFRKEVLDGE